METGQIHSIAYWRREQASLDLLEEVIAEQLLTLSEFHGNELGAKAIGLLTRCIIRACPELTPDDILRFVDEACTGRWKKYGALTPAQVMEWMQVYRNERAKEAEEDSYQAHLIAKAERLPLSEPIIYERAETIQPTPTNYDIDERIKRTIELLHKKYSEQ